MYYQGEVSSISNDGPNCPCPSLLQRPKIQLKSGTVFKLLPWWAFMSSNKLEQPGMVCGSLLNCFNPFLPSALPTLPGATGQFNEPDLHHILSTPDTLKSPPHPPLGNFYSTFNKESKCCPSLGLPEPHAVLAVLLQLMHPFLSPVFRSPNATPAWDILMVSFRKGLRHCK